MSRAAASVFLAVVLLGASCGVALGVVGGKTVSITAAPWTVVIWEKSPYAGQPPYAACTGVIIGPRYILTAGHCVMSRNSARRLPKSSIGVEAGTSNFERLPASDHPQARAITALRVMPGYIAASKVSSQNETQFAGHDLAVLRLSRPLDLKGDDVRAASLPTSKTTLPTLALRLVIAGFGNEKPTGTDAANGTLNEVVSPSVVVSCTTAQVACISSRTPTCSGDSGSGAIEPGQVPTVVAILSLSTNGCFRGSDYYIDLTAPETLRFVESSS